MEMEEHQSLVCEALPESFAEFAKLGLLRRNCTD